MTRIHTLAAILAVAIGSSSAASAQEHPVMILEAGSAFPGSARAVAAGDLDRDGRQDAVVLQDALLRIYYGAATGFGARQQDVALSPGLGSARRIVLGDLTGDGTSDIVILHDLGYVDVLPGPQYSSRGAVMAGSDVYVLALGDVNGDGRLDVVGRSPIGIVVLPNGGEGLHPPVPTPTGSFSGWGLDATAVGDVTGDGLADVVTIADGQPMVHGGSDTGSLAAGVDAGLHSAQRATSVALADMNKDGRLDIVAMTTAPHVLLNNGDGTFTEAGRTSSTVVIDLTVASFFRVELGDYNGDGHVDVAAMRGESAELYAGSAAGVLRGPTAVDLGYTTDFASGDVDGDGFADLILAAPDRLMCQQWILNSCAGPTWTIPGSVRAMHGRLTFATLQLTVDALRTQLEQFRSGNPLEAHVADLASRLADATDRARAHQGETAAAYTLIGALESSIATKDTLISQREATIAARNGEIAGLRSDIALLVQTIAGLQNSLTVADGTLHSLVRYAFVQTADVHAATAARDKTRQQIDRAAAMLGARNKTVTAAELDHKAGVAALAAGNYALAMTSFDNAYTRVQYY